MSVPLVLALVFALGGADTLTVRSDLQALYDEIDQATLAFLTPSDIDQMAAVTYKPDWTFVDTHGQHHSLDEMHRVAVDSLNDPADWRSESIRKVVSVNGDTAVVLVDATVVRKAGKDAKKSDQEMAEVTSFRDTWVRSGDSWRFAMREQVGSPHTSPYDPLRY